ncbi:MAG: GIY-YIG nuclease family protein [Myxococcales bacterium]|nr:GIY-YIG nuclease family protein [Myxococcales bacterium]
MTDEELAKLIASDTLGLLAVRPRRSVTDSAGGRVTERFGVILRFVEQHGAPPSRLAEDLDERKLYENLAAIRRQPAWVAMLQPHDEYGLLTAEPPIVGAVTEQAPTGAPAPSGARHAPVSTAQVSVEDILDDPLLSSDPGGVRSLFTLKHVAPRTEPAQPDYVAQRRPCPDFAAFQARFEACQADLSTGRRRLLPFAKQQRIETGKFFTLRGVLLLIASVEAPATRKAAVRRDRRPASNPRVRCIFENGTESDMLERSLDASLYKDGRRVTELPEDLLKGLLVTDDDVEAGHIYVLRSLSTRPEIAGVPNLYKIGLARKSIEGRIRNAASEPTYLLAPVALIATYKIFNANLPKVERLLHRFFDSATVKVQVRDAAGTFTTPKEWFSVPLEIIDEAVHLLISGEIVGYQYNSDAQRIESRDSIEVGED